MSAADPDAQLIALNEETIGDAWPRVLARLPPLLGSQVEKAGLPAIFGPNALALRFPSEYNQQREHCQRPETLARIEETLRKLTGSTWNLRIESVAVAAGPLTRESPPAAAEPPPPRPRPTTAAVEKEPLIRRALDALGAQILRVDEGFGMVPAEAGAWADEIATEEA